MLNLTQDKKIHIKMNTKQLEYIFFYNFHINNIVNIVVFTTLATQTFKGWLLMCIYLDPKKVSIPTEAVYQKCNLPYSVHIVYL